MALPNLPSANTGNDKKQPASKKGGLPVPPSGGLPKSPPKRIEVKPEKKERAALPQQERSKTRVKRKSTTVDNSSEKSTSTVPVKKRSQKQEGKARVEESSDDGWTVHKKTGVRYKKIPPAKYDSDGKPVPTITDDIDDPYDLNSAADKFLAHLRVAPDPAEQKRVMEEKMRLRQEQNKKYQEETSKIVAKD